MTESNSVFKDRMKENPLYCFQKRNCRVFFSQLGKIDLNKILDSLSANLKNDNGNWSMLLADDFAKKNKHNIRAFASDLKDFFAIYFQKTKKQKTGLAFSEKYYKQRVYKKPLYNIQLREDADVKQFITDVRTLKDKYLKCTITDIIELLSGEKGIDISLSENTIKKYITDLK